MSLIEQGMSALGPIIGMLMTITMVVVITTIMMMTMDYMEKYTQIDFNSVVQLSC